MLTERFTNLALDAIAPDRERRYTSSHRHPKLRYRRGCRADTDTETFIADAATGLHHFAERRSLREAA